MLSIVLLAFTLGAFWLQHAWLGKKVYTTVTGKGDAGLPLPLPRRVALAVLSHGASRGRSSRSSSTSIILVGGFVRSMGRDYTPTLEHFLTAFRVERADWGLYFSGSAWNSFFATMKVAAISAPLTAAIGLLTAYLLTRQRFSGQRAFEFGTLLSFAIPGTVVGVSYILAFNVPPIEITGTGFILVMCFVFRNMPVGVRSGIATLSQIDKSLDEASLDARRALVHHHAPRGAAAAAAGHRRLAGLFLRARHDRGERRDLPRHRRVQHGDRPISSAASRRASSASPSPIPPCSSSSCWSPSWRSSWSSASAGSGAAARAQRPRPLPCRRFHEPDVLHPLPLAPPRPRSRRPPSNSAT